MRKPLLIALLVCAISAFAQGPSTPQLRAMNGRQKPTGTIHAAGACGSQHGNCLTWSETTSGTTFNVYRGSYPGGEGATPIASPTTLLYLDSSCVGGQLTYYKVTAVLNGIESAPSSEASGVCPIVPTSPTNLVEIQQ